MLNQRKKKKNSNFYFYELERKAKLKMDKQNELTDLEKTLKHLKNVHVSALEEDGKIKPKNIEKFGICIQKAQAIITELQVSLDMEKGGDIARNLMSLYLYLFLPLYLLRCLLVFARFCLRLLEFACHL